MCIFTQGKLTAEKMHCQETKGLTFIRLFLINRVEKLGKHGIGAELLKWFIFAVHLCVFLI